MENHQRRLVISLFAYAVYKDVSAIELARLAGIDLDELKNNEEIVFTSKQINDLWLNAAHLTKDELFGLHFGESLQLSALGTIGEIIKNSTTIGEALTIAANLTHLITNLFKLEIIHSKDTFTLQFVPLIAIQKDVPFSFKQTLDLFMVFSIRELDGLLFEKIKPLSVNFPYEIINTMEYERVMRCAPSQKSGAFSLTFDNKCWNMQILMANYDLQKSLLEKVASLENQVPVLEHTFQSRIYNYLLTNSYLGIVSIEEIAANFNISSRGLQRRLKEVGITYQQLADEARKSLAIHYLRSANYQVKEISYMLGYNEVSAFSKAFKRWTGTSPVDYQRSAFVQ
ncbi:AraC family transcriptional regulator [Solitalea canadensis]|uniref:DNA-binding domain-containing protein, AraC-type n=1 Tax=Solitalea canadensis (strain ATCC 29591 / DSM 3403 / JCM 21819 / LMG 8368 / NBRC 15130 / NCIMB 12057 / USAM 9D) TaxID=929556 RepID=H8KQL5_SOLCM|nr:AraC family transcriptional regulator [Solitalea canadensis]AFD06753.1 DNA-binding domain-containing protein, AraC-type [Solitalea canadensis DSM 3403]